MASPSHDVVVDDARTPYQPPPPDAPTAVPSPVERQPLPFASRVQAILIGVMLVGFVFIAQQWSKGLYQIGLPIIVVSAFLQIAFGNIPPASGARRSLTLLAVTWVLVAAIFGLAIVLAPTLIDFGR